jgi:hypothetical protein
MAMRISWHSAGTFDKNDGSGGSNGGTMRFEPEKSDGANNGKNEYDMCVNFVMFHAQCCELWVVFMLLHSVICAYVLKLLRTLGKIIIVYLTSMI